MKAVGLCVAVAIALGGCATLMAPGPDHVQVMSNPPGASVYVDDVLVGQTPTWVTLDRENSRGLIRVEAFGYAPLIVVRSKHINGWFWGNLCFGGVLGMVIDLVTGDAKAFDDTPVNVLLAPYGPPTGPRG